MNTRELIDYYANLLILQYIGKPRAYATIQTLVRPVIMPQVSVQTITFAEIPDAGSFVLSYGEGSTQPINWDDPTSVIQSKIRSLAALTYDGGDADTTGVQVLNGGAADTTIFSQEIDGGDAFGFSLGPVTVTGSIASGILTVTFFGIDPPADVLTLVSTTLTSSGDPVTPVITEVDLTLPLAVQDAFNLIMGTNIAQGVQLDVLGKYVGVTRTANGFTESITLNDADFIQLIRMGIIRNNNQSSLSVIQEFLHHFFPDEVLVFDHKTMRMSYLISSAIGSQDLVQLFVTEGLLPRPMAVLLYPIIYAPVINAFFSFRTYDLPAYNASPFNDYSDYQTDWPWLSYADQVLAP